MSSDSRDKLQKLYFRIGEVANIVGVEPHVLRYWESEFRSVRPQKSARGQRIYSRRDVETLLRVKELLYAHRFTIAGAKRRLREGSVEPATQDAAEATLPPPAPARAGASIGVAEAIVVRDRLLALRDRAKALLLEVEGWGELEGEAPLPKQR